VTLVFLLVIGLGPLLWLAKSSITPTQDTLRQPMALWPHGFDLGYFATAWTRTHIDRYFLNTVWIAAGSWFVQLLVAATAGYALSVLRPRFARLITGLVVATLFVPAIVLLVPLYLTVVDMPVVHLRLIDSYWAVWLPAGANAFNVVIMKRFFDNLPREIFEAARVDGAGPFRLFWSIVLPMSRPILGVVSVFAVIGTWKDYLWPLLVLRNPDIQPLSVRLPTLQPAIEFNIFLAALAITTLIPIVLFLLFQRMFLRGGGLSGAIKG
jgi:multiple sugar transport system permease protein